MKLTERHQLFLCWSAASIALAVFAWPLFVGRIYTNSDLGAFNLPVRWFYQNCLLSGDSPNWIPQLSSGMYLHGEGQGGFYHPLHYLLYRFLPLSVAFDLELLWAYPFMLVGSYLFLRRWAISAPAAIFGAFCFMFSSYTLVHAVHMQLVEVVAHMPWLLVCLDIALRDRPGAKQCVALAGITCLTGSQLLFGFPQSMYHSLIAETLYTLFLVLHTREGKRLLHVGIAKFLGVLIGAIQLIPTYEAFHDSSRVHESAAFNYYLSLPPINVLQFLGPGFFRDGVYGGTQLEFALFPGSLATLLTLWALMRLPKIKEHRASGYSMAALVLMALFLSFGQYGGLYHWITKLPLLEGFRASCRHIVLVHFGMAILAAIGFSDLMSSRPKPKIAIAVLLLPVLLSWGVALTFLCGRAWLSVHFPELAADIARPGLVLLGPSLMTLGALLIYIGARGKSIAFLLLFMFTVAEQSAYGFHYLWYWSTPCTISAYQSRTSSPPDGPNGRVQITTWPPSDALITKGFRLSNAYAGFTVPTGLSQDDETALRVCGVKWVENSQTLGSTLPLCNTPENRHRPWVEIRDPMPRFRLLNDARVGNNVMAMLPTIDIEQTAVVDTPVSLDTQAQGTFRCVEDRPGLMTLQTETTGGMLLAVSETYHHGWTLTMDGRPAAIVRVYGDFMGAVAPIGNHTFQFVFRPESFIIGRWITLGSIAIAVLYYGLLFWIIARRSTTPTTSAKTESPNMCADASQGQ